MLNCYVDSIADVCSIVSEFFIITFFVVVAIFRPKMASTLDDFEVVSTIGTGSYGTCKKIRRKKDGKVFIF